MIGDCFGRIMPITYINLPLYYNDSNKFASKRITFFSILVFTFVSWNSYNNIYKIGKIVNIF